MKELKRVKGVISFLFVFVTVLCLIPIVSINVDAASCKCANPSASSRIIAPTCTTEGYKETYCTKCSGSLSPKTDIKAKLGHAWKTTKAATCGAAGTKKCSRCSQTQSIPATGNHSPASRIVRAATCVTKGKEEVYCRLCNVVLSIREKDTIAHDWKIIKGATCGANGMKQCSACQHKEAIQATGNHSPASRITKAPTCSSIGTKEVYCKLCNEIIVTRNLAKIAHDWETIKGATCGTAGMQKCNVCQQTEEIQATGNHSPAKRIKEAATCTTTGIEEIYCKLCNNIIETNTIPENINNHFPLDIDPLSNPRWSLASMDINKHEVKCRKCGEWFKSPHTIEIISNQDGTHSYKCIVNKKCCGMVEKVEECNLVEKDKVINDNGYTKEIITTYSCTDCNYFIEKTTYKHYKHTKNIKTMCDIESGTRRMHLIWCDDEYCEGTYVSHIFAYESNEQPLESVRCIMCDIGLVQAEGDYSSPSYSSGGVDPFGGTNAYDFAPDDSESKMNAWDKITEFDPDQENVFFYWCNGKESYIVWNLKTAYKFDCATAEEFKKKVEEEYCTRVIQATEP